MKLRKRFYNPNHICSDCGKSSNMLMFIKDDAPTFERTKQKICVSCFFRRFGKLPWKDNEHDEE